MSWGAKGGVVICESRPQRRPARHHHPCPTGNDFNGSAPLVRACRGVLSESVVEDHIGQLGLLISLPLLHPPAAVAAEVAPVLLQVFGCQRKERRIPGPGGMIHNPRLALLVGRRLKQVPKQRRQQELRQVVGLHLYIEPVRGGRVQKSHDASVETEDVELADGLADGGRGFPNAREAAQVTVDMDHVRRHVGHGLQFLQRGVGTRRRAVQQNDPRCS
mmetsp:Transcript_96539/g.275398  ORF Transcript_96539/g.275398 Transcript_96539/m.275398 type:complete len:218 (+) Transcript_96539:715-1368(+)